MLRPPDVSVLIPVYNNPHTLARAVRSALGQPGVNVQVVICDDASTDGQTWDVVKALSTDDPKFPNCLGYRRTENGRIAETLNTSMRFGYGKYIIRLDSDDWFEPGCLARMKAVLDANPDITFAYGQRRYYGRRSDTYTPRPFNPADFSVHNAAGYCYLFRREVWESGIRWEALGTFGGAVIDLEDWQHLLEMIHAGHKGMALSDTLVLHYTFGYSGTWQELKNHEAEALAELRRRFPGVKATSL